MISAAAYLWKRWQKKARRPRFRRSRWRSVPHHSRQSAGENLAGIPRHAAAARADPSFMLVN